MNEIFYEIKQKIFRIEKDVEKDNLFVEATIVIGEIKGFIEHALLFYQELWDLPRTAQKIKAYHSIVKRVTAALALEKKIKRKWI